MTACSDFIKCYRTLSKRLHKRAESQSPLFILRNQFMCCMGCSLRETKQWFPLYENRC